MHLRDWLCPSQVEVSNRIRGWEAAALDTWRWAVLAVTRVVWRGTIVTQGWCIVTSCAAATLYGTRRLNSGSDGPQHCGAFAENDSMWQVPAVGGVGVSLHRRDVTRDVH